VWIGPQRRRLRPHRPPCRSQDRRHRNPRRSPRL